MDALLRKVHSMYMLAVYERADPRTAKWLLVESPLYPIVVVACYLYCCVNARLLTAKMPTYNLKWFIVVYNAAMVALSGYMTYEFAVTAYLATYSLTCQPVDFTYSPLATRMARVCWLYYFSKYIELIETGVFALRKKYQQISFLHVYHHSSMICIWWMCVKYIPGGQAYIFGGVNSFVHTVMYTYYGLSAGGPKMQKFLWWKKYITMLQLSQFVVLFFFCIRSIAIDCQYAKWMCWLMIGYAVTLLVLFLNFYVQAYLNKDKRKVISKPEKNGVTANGTGTKKHQ